MRMCSCVWPGNKNSDNYEFTRWTYVMVDSCEPGEYFFFVKLDYVFLFKMHNLELST